ncbi:MAG TPA: hypothetical protein ENH53_03125 [Bacteroidetes bacterium]|nr:hypothetical protein [Bacteroidota bacterium]
MHAKLVKSIFLFGLIAAFFPGCQHRLIKQPLPQTSEQWTQWGGNCRQTFFIKTNAALAPLKRVKTIKLSSSPGKTLLVSGKILFVSTLDGKISTFSLDTFKKLGDVRLPRKLAGTAALFQNELIVALRFSKKSLFRLNPLTGKKRWTADLGSIETEPLIYNSRIYVTTLYKGVVAVDGDSGKIIWEKELQTQSHSSPNLIQNDLVFGDDRGKLRALKPDSGDSLWTASLEGIIRAMPVGDEKRIYIGTTQGNFYALDLETGKIAWKFSVNAGIFQNAAIAPEGVFLAANNGFLYKLTRDSGKLIWKQALDGVAGAPPLIFGAQILLGTLEHKLLVLDRLSGKILRSIKLKGRIRTMPIVNPNTVIAGSEEHWLYIFARGGSG